MSRGYSVMYANGKYINFENGFRRTIRDESIESKGNIFVFGPCFVRGLAQEDKNTIASTIQKKLPESRVHNYGSEFGTLNLVMRLPEYHEGDIAIIFDIKKYHEDKDHIYDAYYDMTDTWCRVRHLWKHLFDDPMHYDNMVHYMLVDDLTAITEKVFMYCKNAVKRQNATVYFGAKLKRAANLKQFSDDQKLLEWIDYVELCAPYSGERRGAIVMNCNPFTNGHRYLIETSCKKVDKLFVFVLQEDKSYFSFDDRIYLVKAGTADLDNVVVLPSGEHIISAQTLPGYFNKKELSDTAVDLSRDLDFFVKIAETLHISIRFAGKEPLDPFTNRYNEKMSRLLPQYGVKFEEIERISQGGSVVSASRVRKCLGKGKLEEIRDLVPETTYKYLKDKVSDKQSVYKMNQ